jgi:hypothetical protein
LLKEQPYYREGYQRVELYLNCIRKRILVHRLVAETFIANPENKKEVNHKNGLKYDNRMENLEWVTPEENSQHAVDTGLLSFRRLYKFSSAQAEKIRSEKIRSEYTSTYGGIAKLSREYGVSRGTIRRILRGYYEGNTNEDTTTTV